MITWSSKWTPRNHVP